MPHQQFRICFLTWRAILEQANEHSAVLSEPIATQGSAREVFQVFLKLGLTSFGGPVAHLGYFRAEFVERRRWLSDRAYVDLAALSQFLPGPASSQTGFGIGLVRAGYLGGLAAWLGFTLPSALFLLLFAYGSGNIADAPFGTGLLHGLKLVAVAIVAQAVLGMAGKLCPDKPRTAIALTALAVLAFVPASLGQVAAIAPARGRDRARLHEKAPYLANRLSKTWVDRAGPPRPPVDNGASTKS